MVNETKIMKLFRKANKEYKNGNIRRAKVYQKIIRLLFSAEIPYSVEIGKGVDFKHGGLGVVIHEKAIIGENTIIFQNVTIGGMPDGGVPRIGTNVYIGSGAVILGGIVVGDNVKIGANAVVLEDIPNNCTAVGIPATIIMNKLGEKNGKNRNCNILEK